jgi:tetratricopeptide (TPR) repeat protein
MDHPFILLLSGFLYIMLFGGLSWIRREGLPIQQAFEALAITIIVVVAAALRGYNLHPAIFLFGLYLLTMRVRLLLDIANIFARRRQFKRAESLYLLAEKLFPDQAGQVILQINRGILALQQGDIERSISQFEAVLEKIIQGWGGLKHEAAVNYNLGVAFLRQGEKVKATIKFNEVMDILPASEYARRSEAAIARAKKSG